MSAKLYIGNISFDVDEQALEDFITTSGVQVANVQIIRDKMTGRSRGFGFAELSEADQLQTAIDTLNGKELIGRNLTVSEARERQPRSNRGGYQGSSRGQDFNGNSRRSPRW